MNKKSVSASILVLFLALVFAVIGACFNAFVYKKNIIEFKDINIISADGIKIFEDKELKKEIKKLKLSNMELGLKPATGEIDADLKIPYSVTAESTSEGYYETIYVKSNSSYKILVKNIKITTENNQLLAEEERENIYIAIQNVKNTAKSLKKDEIELVRFDNVVEAQSLTLLFWLGSFSDKGLVGSKISFDLEFVAV